MITIPPSTRRITYSVAINETLRHEMRRDEKMIVLGEDIAGGAGKQDQGIVDAWGGPFGKTRGLITEFGAARVRDCPISEMAFIGTAVGAAATGLRPVVDLMFIDFLGVCLDQLMNNAAFMRYMFGGKISLPLTVSTMVGAGTGSAGQHSKMLYPLLVHLPGLKVVAPSSAATAKGLYTAAILTSARKTGRVVIVDEAFPRCNVGADIAALVADQAFDALRAPIKRVSPPHVPVPFSPVLERAFIPSAERVACTARAIVRQATAAK